MGVALKLCCLGYTTLDSISLCLSPRLIRGSVYVLQQCILLVACAEGAMSIGAVYLFYIMSRLRHPENYLFMLLRSIFIWSKYPKKTFSYFENILTE